MSMMGDFFVLLILFDIATRRIKIRKLLLTQKTRMSDAVACLV